MDADKRRYLNHLSEQVIGAAFEVSNILGPGYLEKVYENAFARELALRQLEYLQQSRLTVHYKDVAVGEYMADLVVAGQIIVELKCVEAFTAEHLAQCLNYLTTTGLSLALLINFQHAKVQVKRVVRNF